MMSVLAEHALYRLARLLYRTDVVHDSKMKEAQQSLNAHNTYRSQQVTRVLEAAKRFRLPLEGDMLDLGCNDGALTVQIRCTTHADRYRHRCAGDRAGKGKELEGHVPGRNARLPAAARRVDGRYRLV